MENNTFNKKKSITTNESHHRQIVELTADRIDDTHLSDVGLSMIHSYNSRDGLSSRVDNSIQDGLAEAKSLLRQVSIQLIHQQCFLVKKT